jgi:hypothetical protein
MDISVFREVQAIKFLRALVHEPPNVLECGTRNPGWCCSEHAFIFHFAFAVCGLKTGLSEGSLAYADKSHEKESQRIGFHRFLTFRKPNFIFDSSASLGRIEGIPREYDKIYDKVGVWSHTKDPGDSVIYSTISRARHRRVLYYVIKQTSLFPKEPVKFEFPSDFGRWIEVNFGEQEPLWAKVIGRTARILSGHAEDCPVPVNRDNQKPLWEWIKGLPDDRDFVEERLNLMRGE